MLQSKPLSRFFTVNGRFALETGEYATMKTMSAMLVGFACVAMLVTSCANAQEAAPAAAKGCPNAEKMGWHLGLSLIHISEPTRPY